MLLDDNECLHITDMISGLKVKVKYTCNLSYNGNTNISFIFLWKVLIFSIIISYVL